MFRDWVRSRSSPPRTEIESGTSITDCEIFWAVTTTSSRFVASGFSCAQAVCTISGVASAAATAKAMELRVIVVLRALLGHEYSDTDTNVLIRELSTGFGLRAEFGRDLAGARVHEAQSQGRKGANCGQQREEGRMAHPRP